MQGLVPPLPWASILPAELVSALGFATAWFTAPVATYFTSGYGSLAKGHEYLAQTLQLVDQQLAQGRAVYLVGHSLGGAIAQALAAQFDSPLVRAVAFNSPGLPWTQAIFGIEQRRLVAKSINVNAQQDVVSLVDPPVASIYTGFFFHK